MICIVGCGVVFFFFVFAFVLIMAMDGFLNYSMKKKVKTKGIPLWFPSDRKNESAFGPSIEQPNEGTYLPAFICCCITYALSISLIIIIISVHFCLQNKMIDKCILIATAILCGINVSVVGLLKEHYRNKYFKNQPFYIAKISSILDSKEKSTSYNVRRQ